MQQKIREGAIVRISEIFNISSSLLRRDTKFGEDLKSTFVSDFQHNEFDKISHDIHDVADRKITDELNKAVLTIQTVGNYCDHMVRCYDTRPSDVKKLLKLT